MSFSEEIERAEGVSGELVLRRGTAGLEVIANGVFLVSAANAASSRALVAAAWPRASGRGLRVLIGGLGIGDALHEALACERVAAVTVAELEPVVVRWFREHGGEAARRAEEAERTGRVRIVAADVAVLLDEEPGAWDVVALDTDNGPEWLVRGENAALYTPAGLRRVYDALRPGGVAVYWSPERYPLFEGDLADVFDGVERVAAVDVVDGRPHEYTMYVASRAERRATARRHGARLVSGVDSDGPSSKRPSDQEA
jgi:spermidine synthase